MPGEAAGRRAVALGLLALLATAAATGASAATIEVVVSGVFPGAGSVLASLCEGGIDRAACARGQSRPAAAPVLAFVFPDVAPGRYAALAFQDVDGSGVLRRSRMGRPLEPYGLSNDAGRSRRPTFEQAAVRVGTGNRRVAIRLERPGAP